MIQQYLSFILKPFPTHPTLTAFENYPNFYFHWFLWTCFFTFFCLATKYICEHVFQSWWCKLSVRKQKEFPAYLASLIHHFFMVPYAFYQIYKDFQRSDEEYNNIHYSVVESSVGPFSLGYLLGDTFCFAFEAALGGKAEYLIHHVMGVWLVVALVHGPGHLGRAFPHFLLCESSAFCFNLAWVLRSFEIFQGSTLVLILELGFAFFFLFTRVINLPLMFWSMLTSEYINELGVARFILIPLALLQWYWFSIIVSGIANRIPKKDTERKEK